MSKKRKNYATLTPEDAHTIMRSALAFYKVGNRISLRYAKAKRNGKLERFDNDELIVAATNIILSIELNLKALLLLATGAYQNGHGLKELFDKLPSKVRNELDNGFENGKKTVRGDIPIIRRLALVPEKQYDPWNEDITLEKFLSVHNEGFIDWRYQFEEEIDRTLFADFALMQVMHKLVVKSIKNRLPLPDAH